MSAPRSKPGEPREEIEITPEMVEAGVRALLSREDETLSGRAVASLESLVAEVYEEMARHRV